MPKFTILYGILLLALGVGGYLVSAMESYTALIPAVFGVIFLILGLVAAKKESWRKHLMHVAVVLAVLAVFGTFKALGQVPILLSGGELSRPPLAVISQSVTAVLSVLFIGLCVRSFIQARKNS